MMMIIMSFNQRAHPKIINRQSLIIITGKNGGLLHFQIKKNNHLFDESNMPRPITMPTNTYIIYYSVFIFDNSVQ